MDYHAPFDQGLTKLQTTFLKKGWLKLLMAQQDSMLNPALVQIDIFEEQLRPYSY